jgi:LPPG:FO 2-phospho-L-lactate transferase
MNVVALSGGVGGAKFADGLAQSVGPESLTVIVNTADDFKLYGLHISPDLDTVMYTLGNVANFETGWGISGDTLENFGMLSKYGTEPWFRLGDRDIATHMLRTEMLRLGATLTEVTQVLSERLNIDSRILPMTNHNVRTMVDTAEFGILPFQEYFVKHHWQPVVKNLMFDGIDKASPTFETLRALETADTIILAPSNPYLSVEPILGLNGVRDTLLNAAAPIIAITPIIGGEAIKGPAAKMMREMGVDPTPLSVAQHYSEFINGFVLDERDEDYANAIRGLGIGVLVTNTWMKNRDDRARLTCEVVNFADELRPEKLNMCRLPKG